MAQDYGGGDENIGNTKLYFMISDRVPNRFQNEVGRKINILIYINNRDGSIPPLGTTFSRTYRIVLQSLEVKGTT